MDLSKFSLAGKVALVTGGNGGIGFGIAQGLAAAGAKVAICGRNERKNAAAEDRLREIDDGCRAFAFDLENTEGIEGFCKDVSSAMGGIEILVNNAGVICRGRADEVAVEDFERTVRINLTATYVLSQCFARERIRRKLPGSIIMIASLMSEAARAATSAYTATKGAIRQLVKALAVDWAPFGIRVNGIGPGYIRTEMTRPLVEDAEFNSWVVKRTPLGRWGVPEDVQGAAVFLASDAAAFITGHVLYVDGGWLATF
ncbi:MAG: SDR family oxidoreductase [Planctomycetota bacterium]|jgi:gluconate 5-dehydrogenase